MKNRPTNAQAKPQTPKRRRRDGGGVLVGIFIGLVLGLALAAGVAWYFMRGPSPFQQAPASAPAREPAREPAKAAKAEPAPAPSDKPRFDFYRILPGAEEPKQAKAPDKAPDRAAAERAAAERAAAEAADKAARPADRFWLQAGSFATEADAENMKARLALSGWEAIVQSATLPDKGLRYRVRIGPYDNTDELNRIKAELGRRGFDVAVIKY
jgi:cell division protein FtsN